MDEWKLTEKLCFQEWIFGNAVTMMTKACGAVWIIIVNPRRSVTLQCTYESKSYLADIHVVVNEKSEKAGYISQGSVHQHLFRGNETMEFVTGPLQRRRWEIRFYKCKEADLKGAATSVAREFPNPEHVKSSSAICSAIFSTDSKKEQDPQASTTATSKEYSSDLSSLLQTELFSDIELHCDGESDGDTGGLEVFRVHKAILAARSPVFATMLQSPMKEAKDNVVDIRNCKSVVLKIVLEYIYSGQIQQMNDWSTACDILAVADLYQITGLKRVCCEYLCSAATEDNALSILTNGDLYDADLRYDLLNFVCNKFDTLQTTKEWESLRKERPSLAMDVMTAKIQCLSNKLCRK